MSREWRTSGAPGARGATLLEAAIILPFLVIVLAGMCNLVLAMQQIQIVSDALKEGVQAAIALGAEPEAMKEKATEFAEKYLDEHAGALGRDVIKMNMDRSLWRITPDLFEVPLNKKSPAVSMLKLTARYEGKKNCVFCYQNIARSLVPSAYYFQSISVPTGGIEEP